MKRHTEADASEEDEQEESSAAILGRRLTQNPKFTKDARPLIPPLRPSGTELGQTLITPGT